VLLVFLAMQSSPLAKGTKNHYQSAAEKGNSIMDLSSLSLVELKKLQKDIDGAIASFEARRISAARVELETRAKELGFTLKEILDASGAGTKRAPMAVKYRNPEKIRRDLDRSWPQASLAYSGLDKCGR
jgi:hypothetical protein